MIVRGKTVTDDGKPLAGASLTAVFLEHTRFFDAVSGPDGAFAIGPVPFGHFKVVASAPGLAAAEGVATGFKPDVGVLPLLSPRRLAGKILRGGEPARGATVQIRGRSAELKTVAGDDGAFSFSGLAPGSYSLHAVSDLFEGSDAPELQPGKDILDVVVRLKPCGVVTGTVRDRSGAPIAGAEVGSSARRTGSDGTYRLLVCETGLRSYWASAKGYLLSEEREVQVTFDRTSQIDFTLDRASPLAGVVVDQDGEPVPGAAVHALLSGTVETPDAVRGECATGRDGTFSIDPLPPGSFDVTVSHPSFPRLRTILSAPLTTARLVLSRGREIFGTVRDAQGRPVVGSSVMAFPSDEDYSEVYSLGSDAKFDASAGPSGQFRIRGLASGRHVLCAQLGPDGQQVSKEVDADTAITGPIDLQFPPSLSIAGKVLGVGERPIASHKVVALRMLPDRSPLDPRKDARWVATVSKEDGSFKIEGLEPGRYTVWPEGFTSGSKHARQEIEAGKKDVTFVLDDSKARGQVVQESGEPITHFEIEGRSFRDPDGAFEVPLVQLSTDLLRFEAEGFAPTWRRLTPPVGSDVNLGKIVLGKGRPVTGEIVDAKTGAPVAGALVKVSAIQTLGNHDEQTWMHLGSVETGLDGAFTLPGVEPTAVALLAWHKGHCWFARRLGADESRVIVRLERGAVVQGAVADGDGISTVAARSNQGLDYTYASDGRYRFEALPSGTTTFWTSEGGLRTVDVPESGEIQVDLVQSGGVHLVLRVPEGLFAVLIPGDVPLPSMFSEMVTGIRPDGELDGGKGFKRLPPGRYTLVLGRRQVSWTDVSAQPLHVSASPEQRVNVPMPGSFAGAIRE
ncbi:MAG TPA: carboxypeptidase-like regulatory domain-containing protein [Propionicimonas sp.]